MAVQTTAILTQISKQFYQCMCSPVSVDKHCLMLIQFTMEILLFSIAAASQFEPWSLDRIGS
jgi:hypothetical protein